MERIASKFVQDIKLQVGNGVRMQLALARYTKWLFPL